MDPSSVRRQLIQALAQSGGVASPGDEEIDRRWTKPIVPASLLSDIDALAPPNVTETSPRVVILYEQRALHVALCFDAFLTEAGFWTEADYRHLEPHPDFGKGPWQYSMRGVIGSCGACILLRSEASVRAGIGTTPGTKVEWEWAMLLQIPVYDTLYDMWEALDETQMRQMIRTDTIPWLTESAIEPKAPRIPRDR